jgi:hypothetical protein
MPDPTQAKGRVTTEEEAELHWIEEELLHRLEDEYVRKQGRAVAISYEHVALAAAAQGDLRPLRSKYPTIAKFINPPPGWLRGKHRPSPRPRGNYTDRVRWAYADRKNICALAKEHGRKLARSATWYAAHLWDVREEDLKAFKPSGRKYPRTS